MIVKIALNMKGLPAPQQLARLQTVITKLTGNPVFTAPSPSLATAQSAHDDAVAVIEEIAAKEAELDTLRLQRDDLVQAALQVYADLAAHVENKCGGIAANVTSAGFDLQDAPTTATIPIKVENNVLTTGDDAGTLDGSCDAVSRARSYEWQLSDNGVDGFVHYKTTTRSSIHFTGLTSGQKKWSRVRAINNKGEGPWSDPAVAMVP